MSSVTFRWNLSPSSPTLTVTLHQMKLSSPPDGTFSWWTFIRWIFLHSFSSDGRLLNDFTYDDFLLLYSLVASFLMTLVTISSSTSLSYSSSGETFTPGGTSSIWDFSDESFSVIIFTISYFSSWWLHLWWLSPHLLFWRLKVTFIRWSFLLRHLHLLSVTFSVIQPLLDFLL